MKIFKKIILLLTAFIVSFSVIAQEKKVEMADAMKANGRIYVVVAVLLTILTGIIIYLVRLDRKLSRLEKEK